MQQTESTAIASLSLPTVPGWAIPRGPVTSAVAAAYLAGAALNLLDNLGVVCGRGRNPTLRLWPAIFSGEIDVFPSERRNMGQEIGR